MSSPITDKIMTTSSYAGATASITASLTLTEIGVIIGIVTALITFAANLIYQVRKDRREQKLYDAQIKQLTKPQPPVRSQPSDESSEG